MRRAPIALALLALSGCATSGSGPEIAQAPTTPAERGQLYAQRFCSGCHDIGAEGPSPNAGAPTFSIIRLRNNELTLEHRLSGIAKLGHYEMPPRFMSADEIKDVTAFIETVGPPKT